MSLSEAMKNIYTILLIIAFGIVNAQQNISLQEYYNQLKVEGYSDQQIKELAIKNGYNINDLILSDNISNTTNDVVNIISKGELTSSYNNNVDNLEESQSFEIFGSQYFKNLDYNFSPQINIATPLDYELGPGDGLRISLWGASEANYEKNIDRDGKIYIDGVGPIYLSGLTILTAKNKIKFELTKIYSGLNSDENSEKIFIDLSLTSSRSIFINVVGQVNKPGLYTLNGLSNVLHAIYSAGGILENGSYRNIEVIRNGKTISKVDLYKYFTNGKLDKVFLKDQDLIIIPFYENRVTLYGEVKTPGIFELLDNEKLSDLMKYSGGYTPMSLKNEFFISRILNSSYSSFSTSEIDEPLNPGDKIYIYSISDQESRTVEVSGEVLVPGKYSLENIKTIEDLISTSKGFTKNAYLKYASLYRLNQDNSTTVISLDLSKNSKDNNLKLDLKEFDKLIIFNKNVFISNSTVSINGSVVNPIETDFFEGMNLIDLLNYAGGLSIPSKETQINVYSRDSKSSDYFKSYTLNEFNKDDLYQYGLMPYDLVTINQKNKTNRIFVSIQGEVFSPGTYNISKERNNPFNLIQEAGGLTPFAQVGSIYIERDFENNLILNEEFNNNTETVFIPINDINSPIQFLDGDRLVISRFNQEVKVTGEVLIDKIFSFESTKLKDYLKKIILNDNGSKRNILVIYPNKDSESVRNFLFFKKYPKIFPGSEIIIGSKPSREKLTTQEFVGLSSSISTLGLIILQLIN